MGNFYNSGNATLDIFANNKDGTFGVAQTTIVPTASIAVGSYPGDSDQTILVGNFFGTGLPDLAVVDGGASAGVFIIQNNSTDGFSFGTAKKVTVPGLKSATAANFVSTFTDLLISNGSSFTVLANDGTGNFAASFTTLTAANATTLYSTADANFDGHADIYTATLTSTGTSLTVDLVSGSASASSQPFPMTANGTFPVTAAWPGNVNFNGTTLNGTQTVGGIMPTITWATPAPITYGTALSATQLDATATNAAGATVAGTFAYTPAAGTVLTAGTQTLNVTFTPTDLLTYSVAMGTVNLVVNKATPVITWVPNPNTIVALTPLTSGQLDATSSTPGTFVYTPALGAMLTSGTQTLSALFTPTDTTDFVPVTTTTTITVTTGGLTIAPKTLAFGNQTVGTQSAAQSVSVTNMNATVVNISQIAIEAGSNPFDFAQTNNCPAALQAGASCQINFTFKPLGVGLRVAGLLLFDDSTPSSQGVDLSGTGTGGILQVNPGDLKTIAGTGASGDTGDGGPATAAEINSPDGIAFDSKGDLYITDIVDSVVRKVDTNGNITTFAGTGTKGFSGDGGPATAAELNQPFSVTVDASDNVYIQDTGNDVIRKVDAAGVITTFAGTPGTSGHAGDGGPATSATFNQNQGARFDSAGNLYVPQCGDASVRKIDTEGNISTVAGNFMGGFSGDGGPATSAQLQCPSAVAIDSAGNLYIADYFNNRIRKVDTTGIITTIAGDGNGAFSGDGGPATAAEINLPNDLSFDTSGNLYIADSNNGRIRKIDTNGIITTAAGGFENAGSPGVNTPGGVTDDSAGNIYFSDTGNATVSEIFPTGTTPFPATPIGTAATPQTVTLSNVGNVAITIGSADSFSVSGNTSDFSLSGGTCLTGVTLAPSATCTLQISFKPTALGARSLTISVADSALNSPQSFTIAGTGLPPSLALTSITPNTVNYGSPDTTITVTGTGFVASSVVQVNGTAISTTFVSATSLTAIIPAADLLTAGTLQITVFNATTNVVSNAGTFTVATPPLTGTLNGPSSTAPGTQAVLTFNIPPYPVDLTAVLTISLKSSIASGVTDSDNVVFSNGSATYTLTIPAGSTTIPAIPLSAGTVAEMITVTPQLFIGETNVTPDTLEPVTIDVPAGVPQATSAKLTRNGNQLTVTILGFSNTREIVSAAFHFIPTAGATLTTSDFSPPVSTIFSGWFDGDNNSVSFGSSFTYTQDFGVSDTAANIGSVQVTLTNSVGVSTVYTAQ
jgi:hypothetical protein